MLIKDLSLYHMKEGLLHACVIAGAVNYLCFFFYNLLYWALSLLDKVLKPQHGWGSIFKANSHI